jgi:hypothetical protein
MTFTRGSQKAEFAAPLFCMKVNEAAYHVDL